MIPQVAILFMWVQWLMLHVLRGRRTVTVNIDETSIVRQTANRRGYMLSSKGEAGFSWHARIGTRDSRGHATLLAAVTDCAALQSHLPQFLLTKDSALTNVDKNRLRSMPASIRWVQGSDGWITIVNLKPLLTLLRRCVRAQQPDAEIILIMDCASQHTNRGLLMHAARLGLHVVLVPAGCTWLLQPLDTHVFAVLKTCLSEQQTLRRGGALAGVLPNGVWVDIVAHAVQTVIVDRNWAHTFGANGLASTLVQLRPRISDILGYRLPLPLRSPTSPELDVLVGRHRTDLRDAVLRASERLSQLAAAAPVEVAPVVLAACARLPPRPPGWVAGVDAPVRVGHAQPRMRIGKAAPALPADPDLRRTRSGSLY